MKTQTPPDYASNLSINCGTLTRRQMIVGGAIGLAALAVPLPLLDFFPGSAPNAAMAANQNVADGIYAFRYFYANNYSLHITAANPNPIDVVLYSSLNLVNQYWVVKYDADCGGYRISPVCGHTPGMVLTATAKANQAVRTAKDTGASNQRWTFTQNTDSSWSILNMADPTLCVNNCKNRLQNSNNIILYSHEKSGDQPRAWKLDCLAPAVDTNVHYIEDINQLYSTKTKISNIRPSYGEILDMPNDGWSITYSDAGNPIRFTAANQLTSPTTFSFLFKDALDINDTAADVQVDLTILSQSTTASHRVYFELGYAYSYKCNGEFMDGITVVKADKYTVKYTAYSHETGERISLKGAWFTVFSLTGSQCGDPSKEYDYYQQNGKVPDCGYEGVVYLQEKGTVEAYAIKDNYLCNFIDGVWFGREYPAKETDFPGAAGSETNAVAFVCADDALTLQHFVMDWHANAWHLSSWFFPMFCPLGITAPGDPVKTATITG